MKILFLTHYYLPEGNAPASRVSALAKRWAKDGHEVTIVTSAPNVPDGKVYEGYKNVWTSEEFMDGVRVIRIWTYIAPNKGTVRRIINYISYMFSAVIHCLLMKKPDVMIATSPQFFCGWAGVLLHWLRRFPFILEIRDIWPESMSAVNAGLPAWLLKLIGVMEKMMYRSAQHIVTVGAGYVERLKERGVPENKISVVMNGVDRTLFYPRPVNHDLLKKYEVDLRNTEQVIESLRAIDGVVVAAVIRKEKEGFKVSLRSKARQISVGRIARRLNGGGHEMAAGCSISAPTIEEAEKILANNVEMELNEK